VQLHEWRHCERASSATTATALSVLLVGLAFPARDQRCPDEFDCTLSGVERGSFEPFARFHL